mgnify:CR=1 FL=1
MNVWAIATNVHSYERACLKTDCFEGLAGSVDAGCVTGSEEEVSAVASCWMRVYMHVCILKLLASPAPLFVSAQLKVRLHTCTTDSAPHTPTNTWRMF